MSRPVPHPPRSVKWNRKPIHEPLPGGSPLNSASPALDALSFKFAMWAGRVTAACLDVGCGAGVATRAALARGARVVAVDPDLGMLHQLLTQLPVIQFGRICVKPARLDELDFAAGELAAVHISRVLHRLDGDAIQQSLRDIWRWLQPEGKLFLSAFTPSGSYWKDFSAEFAGRAKRGDRWPGYIGDVSRYDRFSQAGTSCHLLSEAVLTRELGALGFEIEDSLNYSLAWDGTQTCCGVVARRPH